MTLTVFLALFTILAVLVSLFTEAVKGFIDGAGGKYSSNVVVLIVAIIVGAGGTILTYIFMGIPFTVVNIVCIPVMILALWIGAMVGYDKVLQMIEQVKSMKLK